MKTAISAKMDSWEFLLQKEGDRSWLPLKTHVVEITEGRYRMLARTIHANTNVEIRLTHQATGEVPTSGLTRRSKRSTNSDGLMAVMGFTYLNAGVWELLCVAELDLFSHLLSDSCSHSIQLQVLPALNSETSLSLESTITYPALTSEEGERGRVETGENFQDLTPSPLHRLTPLIPVETHGNTHPGVSSTESVGDNLLHPDASPKADQVNPPPHTLLSPSGPLPPQIYKPTSTAIASKSPQLPKLPKPQPSSPPEPEFSLQPDTVPAANSHSSKDAAALVPINSKPDNQPAQPITNKSFEIDDGFQALRLQERFWSRINDLVAQEKSDSPQTDLSSLDLQVPPPEVTPPPSALAAIDDRVGLKEPDVASADVAEETDASTNPATPANVAHPTSAADEQLPAPDPNSSKPQPAKLRSPDWLHQPILEPPELSPWLEYKPVPIPELILPAGELIAGDSVTVVVKLPPEDAPLYVKLWVQDRQTRSLVDGPRYLVDFSPTESGSHQAITQLIVPLGCQEIRVEAIAIDTSTQRESHKARDDRVVIPPNFPPIG